MHSVDAFRRAAPSEEAGLQLELCVRFSTTGVPAVAVWRPAASALLGTLCRASVLAFSRGKQADDADGHRRVLHYALSALCKLWLLSPLLSAGVADDSSAAGGEGRFLPEGLLLLQRAVASVLHPDCVASPVLLLGADAPLLGADSRGERVAVHKERGGSRAKGGSKRLQYEAPLAHMCASQALGWLQAPDSWLALMQISEESWA